MSGCCPPVDPRQQGAALLLMVALLALGMLALAPWWLFPAQDAAWRRQQDARALAQAQSALWAWAFAPPLWVNSPHGAETEPGALPYPDRKGLGYSTCTTEGAHLSGSDANLRRLGWLPELGEQARAAMSIPFIANPCDSLTQDAPRDMALAPMLRDGHGQRLWYAVSANVMDRRFEHSTRYRQPITLRTLNQTSGWLTVCDARGQVLSDRVAWLLIAAGPPLPGQHRDGSFQRSDYLDRLSFLAGADPRCGTSGRNDDGDNRFVQASPRAGFNDTVLYVEVEHYRAQLVRWITRFLARQLRSHGALPSVRYADVPLAMATPSLLDPDPFPFTSSPWCASLRPDANTVAVKPCQPSGLSWPAWWAGSYNRNLNDPDRPSGVELDTWAASLRLQQDGAAIYVMFDGDPRCWRISPAASADTALDSQVITYFPPLPSTCPV